MATRMQRIQIAQETLRILREGWYLSMDGNQVSIEAELAKAVSGSRFWSPDALTTLMADPAVSHNGNGRASSTRMQIRVADESTIQGIRYLLNREAPRVLALNFASAKHPGGGFLSGAQAQEESLALSTGLYPCLTPFMEEMYVYHRQQRSPFYSDRMIYSPRVPLFRDDQYILLPQPYFVSILTAPAVNVTALRAQAPEQLMAVVPAMRQRCAYVLAVAKSLGYRYLVLGAWGAGIFGQDPHEVAGHFAYHLMENPYFKGAFDRIRFSILDSTPDQSVLTAFRNWF